MEKKYGIGLFAAALLMIAGLSFAYRTEYQYMQERAEEEETELKKEAEEKKTVSTQGDAKKQEIYYLAELNGYVVVYLNDRTTVFEYTNIRITDLPEDMQGEIRAGKILEGTEKLYGFLENYSS